MDGEIDKGRRKELVDKFFKRRLKKRKLKISDDLPHWTNDLKTTSGACGCYLCKKQRYNRAKENKLNKSYH